MGRDLTITADGATVEQVTGTVLVDSATVAAMARVEIDSQVATARAYPRSIKTAISNILSLATLDEETATECIYEVKRGDKKIRGPSIRLAEIIASQWGNCRDAAQVVSIDRVNKVVVAEGAFHDLEANRGTRAGCQRRISDKNGKLFSDDMIVVTGNAACSIARRNAILAGVPKPVWRQAQDACEAIIRGKAATLAKRRGDAMEALSQFKLTADQVFKYLDVKGIEDIDLDGLVSLRVMYSALKNGEQNVDDILRSIEPEKQRVTAASAISAAPAVFDAGVPTADAGPALAAELSASQPVASPEQAKAPVDSTAAQPSLFGDGPQREQEPDADGVLDDLDVIKRDIIARLNGVVGNAAALRLVVNETKADFELLDPERRRAVQAAFEAAQAKSKKVA